MAGKREIVADVMKAMEGSEVTKRDVEIIVTHVFKSIDRRTKDKERVTIRGFGAFHHQWRKQKGGRNPQTGERITMPGHYKLALKVK